jgi:hypothetical protein
MATFDVNVNVGSGSEDAGLVPTSDGAGGIDWKKAVSTDGNPEGISPISSADGVSPIELRRYRDSNTIDAQADTGAVSFNLKFSDAGQYWYSDNAGNPVEEKITQAGRDLLDDGDAAAQRTTLGLGALATKSTVATADIDDNAVTFAKLEDIASGHLIGRHTAGAGDPQSIGIDGGLELQGANLRRAALTGDVTASAGNNATTIANDAVTNAKLANMAQATIKGRQAGAGTGDPEDLTASQARTALGLGTAALSNTGDFDAAGSAAAAQAAAIAASQPLDADLTAIAGLSTNGLVERTGAGTAAIRAIGVAASTDVPTRADADGRYELASATSRSGISSPFTTNSASLVDVTGLSVTLQANSVYQFYAYIVCQSTNTSTGFGQTFSFTNSPTKIHLLSQQQRTLVDPITTALNDITASDDVLTQTTVPTANADFFCLTRGVIVTGANASVAQARLVRGGSANNVSAQYGYIIAHKIS